MRLAALLLFAVPAAGDCSKCPLDNTIVIPKNGLTAEGALATMQQCKADMSDDELARLGCGGKGLCQIVAFGTEVKHLAKMAQVNESKADLAEQLYTKGNEMSDWDFPAEWSATMRRTTWYGVKTALEEYLGHATESCDSKPLRAATALEFLEGMEDFIGKKGGASHDYGKKPGAGHDYGKKPGKITREEAEARNMAIVFDGCKKPGEQSDIKYVDPAVSEIPGSEPLAHGAHHKKIATRCCNNNQKTAAKKKCISRAASCLPHGVDFATSRKACTDLGDYWDLCTSTQLLTDMCCDSGAAGCNFDNHYTWTSDMEPKSVLKTAAQKSTDTVPEGTSLTGSGKSSTVAKPAMPKPTGTAKVGGDPFVTDQSGKRVQFYLPVHKDEMLLHCFENFQMFGASFPSGIPGDHQQWFDKFSITLNKKEVLKVGVKKNSTIQIEDDADISAPLVDPQSLQVSLQHLDVVIEGQRLHRTGAVASGDGILFAVWQHGGHEVVQVSYESIVMQIKSAVAQKFDTKDKQRLYSHLDMHFVEIEAEKCSGGTLAEIWGWVPMSRRTAAMLEPPNDDGRAREEPKEKPAEATDASKKDSEIDEW